MAQIRTQPDVVSCASLNASLPACVLLVDSPAKPPCQCSRPSSADRPQKYGCPLVALLCAPAAVLTEAFLPRPEAFPALTRGLPALTRQLAPSRGRLRPAARALQRSVTDTSLDSADRPGPEGLVALLIPALLGTAEFCWVLLAPSAGLVLAVARREGSQASGSTSSPSESPGSHVHVISRRGLLRACRLRQQRWRPAAG
jgi:hypothetical protein